MTSASTIHRIAISNLQLKLMIDWSSEQLEKFADEIRSYLGNYLLRSVSAKIYKLIDQLSASEKESLNEKLRSDDSPLAVMRGRLGEDVKELMEKNEVGEALGKVVDVLRQVRFFMTRIFVLTCFFGQGNLVMTETAPWASPPSTAYIACCNAAETLRVAGICLQPFVPGVASALLDALGVSGDERTWEYAGSWAGSGVSLEKVKRVKLFQPKSIDV